jgi:hypothetical protein
MMNIPKKIIITVDIIYGKLDNLSEMLIKGIAVGISYEGF